MKKKISLFASLLIPLNTPSPWVHGHFGSTKPNTVVFSETGLKIKVQSSASPLFYRLDPPKIVSHIIAKGSVDKLPTLPEPEGTDSGDDLPLRLGLVEPGPRPGWLARLFLPSWIEELLDIDKEQGFSSVQFYTLAQTNAIGPQREHPKMTGVFEHTAAQISQTGIFTLNAAVNPPLKAFALWVQSDGDDSKSSFELSLRSLELQIQ